MSSAALEGRDRDFDSRTHAAQKRAEKRVAAEEMGVDAQYIDRLVETFYGRIRQDEILGPIFDRHVSEWPPHLARMKAFWRSILHNSGEFSGSPMAKHMAIPGLGKHHFSHWLQLFYATLRDLEEDPAATALVGGRARMIADSLLTAIAMRRDGLSAGRVGKDLPHV